MSEVRLIDANALKKAFDEYGEKAKFTQDFCQRLIDNAPTVEPEITEKQAILFLINNGWLVNHDKELRERWERPQGEWISVSERMPEEKINPNTNDFVEVLCSTVFVGNVRVYKYGKPMGSSKAHFWDWGEIMDEYVIAWQPLPEPYKEGGAE